MKGVIGVDQMTYGVQPSQKILETFIELNLQQESVPRPFDLEEIFPPSLITAL